MERIGELIRTAAIFTPGERIKPVWFDWRRRQHKILETSYFWKEQVGDTVLLHFSVTDGGALFELVYDTREQLWRLQGIEVR
jgi:hypothetical protein